MRIHQMPLAVILAMACARSARQAGVPRDDACFEEAILSPTLQSPQDIGGKQFVRLEDFDRPADGRSRRMRWYSDSLFSPMSAAPAFWMRVARDSMTLTGPLLPERNITLVRGVD